MNEKQARSEELEFTGIYCRSKEEVKSLIAEERAKYPGVRIVQVNEGTGYAAYAEPKYRAYKQIGDAQKRIEGHDARVKRIKEAFEADMKKEEDYLKAAQESLEKNLKIVKDEV